MICTSRRRPDYPIASTAVAAIRRSRTSPTERASASSTTRRSRSLSTSTTTAMRIWWGDFDQPSSLHQRRRRTFLPVPDTFRFARPLQEVLTSITIADYDRDSFVDCIVRLLLFRRGETRRHPSTVLDAATTAGRALSQ